MIKYFFRNNWMLIAAMGFIVIASSSIMFQRINVSSPLAGNGIDTPIHIDTTIAPYLGVTGHEAADKHWFGANLVSNGNHIHDAKNHYTRVDHIGYFQFIAGNTYNSIFYLDSNYIALQGYYGVELAGGINTLYFMDDDSICLSQPEGNVRMPYLQRDDAISDVVGYDDATGQLYKRTVTSTALPYKIWRGLLSQPGNTDDPTVIELENTLGGAVTWNYADVGDYEANCTGCFTLNKTVIDVGTTGSQAGGGIVAGGERATNDFIFIFFFDTQNHVEYAGMNLNPVTIYVYY